MQLQIKLASRWCSFLWLPITRSSTFALLCSLDFSYTSSCSLRKGSPKGSVPHSNSTHPHEPGLSKACSTIRDFPINTQLDKWLSLYILPELSSLVGGRHSNVQDDWVNICWHALSTLILSRRGCRILRVFLLSHAIISTRISVNSFFLSNVVTGAWAIPPDR